MRFEVAWQILHLPALLRRRFSLRVNPQQGQARSAFAQLVDLRAHRKGSRSWPRFASPLAALHTTQLFGRLSRKQPDLPREQACALVPPAKFSNSCMRSFRLQQVSARPLYTTSCNAPAPASREAAQPATLQPACYAPRHAALLFLLAASVDRAPQQRKHHQMQRVLVAGQSVELRSQVATYLVDGMMWLRSRQEATVYAFTDFALAVHSAAHASASHVDSIQKHRQLTRP